MCKLLIKNIGPIKNNFTQDYIEIDKLTVFLGPQGSGKSTIAKIFSSLSWLEKSIIKEEILKEQYNDYEFFINKIISYQGIKDYFCKDSYIHFIGQECEIELKEQRIKVVLKDSQDNYKMPKIMYVPAERNFLTAIVRPEFIKGLPRPLYTFLEEFEHAKEWVAQQKTIALPIGGKFAFDKETKKTFIFDKNFKIELLNASSGFQSLVPLFIVTEYLANFVLNKKDDPSYEFFNIIQKNNINKKVADLLESYNNDELSDSDLNSLRSTTKKIMDSYQYKSFINIVEEPEQNLYPESQKRILFSLIQNVNKIKENKLVITSHSPYILNYITLCTEAYKQYQNKNLKIVFKQQLREMLPESATINIDKVNAYALDIEGNITNINKEYGFIDDDHELNQIFSQTNYDFAQLLDME